MANGDYSSAKLRRLRAPALDADALARVLQDPAIGSFDVELVRDQPEHVLRRRIAHFFADRRREDLLLLHMSCHGLKDDEGHLFFATVDTEFDDLDSTAVPEDFVRRQMAKSRSGRIVLLLDCCYSGAFSRGMAARAGTGVELKERFAGRGRAVITASNAMEYSFEGDDLSGEGEPSIFTRAIVKALETGQADRDRDGWIGIDELYEYVYDEVRGSSPQHPLKWVDLEGDLRIARSVYVPPVQPAELPTDLLEAIGSGDRHTRLGAVHVLGNLLAGSNVGISLAARQALLLLAQDDSRLVSEAANRIVAKAPPEHVQAAPMTETGVEAVTTEKPANQTFGPPPSISSVAPPPPAVWLRNPRLAGDPLVGQQLDLTDLSVRGDPVEFSFEWQRELRDGTRVVTVQDADEDHYQPGPEDLGCRLRARITARGALGRSVADTEWSVPVSVQPAGVPRPIPQGMVARVRAAGAVAVVGAVIAIGSLLLHNPYQRMANFGYRGVVVFMSVGVILLIGIALRFDRDALLLAGAGLALVLLGVTFPMSWTDNQVKTFPTTPAFWVGVCGAAIAALGATAAAWLSEARARPAGRAASGQTLSRSGRAALAMPGALIVLASLFILPEWSTCEPQPCNATTTWENWQDPIHRYPSAIILLCGLIVALAVTGIRLDRRRVLLAAAAVACLLLGEAVPLIYTSDPHWGPGRWLGIFGAFAAVAGLVAAARTTPRIASASRSA